MVKKLIVCLCILLEVVSLSDLKAQSLKDLFNKESIEEAAGDLLGKKGVPDLAGTWRFEKSASEFKTENLLKKGAGAVASVAVESKLDEYYAKIGIVPGEFEYTFNADGTFVNTYRGRNFSGTYTVVSKDCQIKFTYLKIFNFTATFKQSGKKLTLLFDADVLLKLFSAISSVSSSASLKMIGNLADEYDGLRLGFKFVNK